MPLKQTALYMVTTADAYELPLAIGTADEIAEFLGIKQASLYAAVSPSRDSRYACRYGGRNNVRIFKIDDIDE